MNKKDDTLVEWVKDLLDRGVGDVGRLEHILNTVQKGEKLFDWDYQYVIKLLSNSAITSSKLENDLKSTQIFKNKQEKL